MPPQERRALDMALTAAFVMLGVFGGLTVLSLVVRACVSNPT